MISFKGTVNKSEESNVEKGLGQSNNVLNKDFIDPPLPEQEHIVINGYSYEGEFPPYRKDAVWFQGFNKTFIDNLPRYMLEALFFNNKDTFSNFVKNYKNTLKVWAKEARNNDLKNPNDIQTFFRAKLTDYFSRVRNDLIRLYPGLTENQYKLLMIMNLAHGNYEFATQTDEPNNLLELVEFIKGDCSELEDLTASLANLLGIEGKYLGLYYDYNTPIGVFSSGHQVFYAEGLWIDSEINTAFKINFEQFLKVKSSERLDYLINNKLIYGFYDWYLNPKVRKEQLLYNQDGGTIAFYYYYYFEGIDQGKSNMMPYLSKVMLNQKNTQDLSFQLKNDISYKSNNKSPSKKDNFNLLLGNIWKNNLIDAIQKIDMNADDPDIFEILSLLNAFSSLIEYENNNKIDSSYLDDLSYQLLTKIFDSRIYRQNKTMGWAYNDEDFRKNGNNSYVTFEFCYSILNVVDKIYQSQWSNVQKDKYNKIIDQVDKTLSSWQVVYHKVNDSKSYYSLYSKDDNNWYMEINGSAISAFYLLYRFKHNNNDLITIQHLLSYVFDFIKLDKSASRYYWPFDLNSGRMDDIVSCISTIRALLLVQNLGIIKNFNDQYLFNTVKSIWSGDPLRPNVYISSEHTNFVYPYSDLFAAINFAQFTMLKTKNNDLYNKAFLILFKTSNHTPSNLKATNSLKLQLLGLLLNQ
jgi:hypothetical protein